MALPGTKNDRARVLPKALVPGGDVEVKKTGGVTSTQVIDKAADDGKQTVVQGGSFGQVVEASAAVFALLFSGALDVDRAIAADALRISGDRSALERLRGALGGAAVPRG